MYQAYVDGRPFGRPRTLNAAHEEAERVLRWQPAAFVEVVRVRKVKGA